MVAGHKESPRPGLPNMAATRHLWMGSTGMALIQTERYYKVNYTRDFEDLVQKKMVKDLINFYIVGWNDNILDILG